MGGIVFGCIAPHPPILVPEIGGGQLRRVEKTVKGMKELADEMARAAVETIVLVSPHSPSFQDSMGICTSLRCSGDFANFGVPEVGQSFLNDLDVVEAIQEEAKYCGIKCASTSQARSSLRLDWGVMVPMYFLRRAAPDARLVSLSFSWLSYPDHYAFGKCLRRAAETTGRRVAVVASGDMSHRLTPDAPAGYDPMGRVFDERMQELVSSGPSAEGRAGLLALDRDLVERAGECGLRSVIILMGALDGLQVEPRLISYEGPFGVGYLVASFKVKGGEESREAAVAKESPFVQLARDAVEGYIRDHKVVEAPQPLPAEMRGRAGVFVSLHIGRALRGCIGTWEPLRDNIAEEIVHNAISAATRDPRFSPVPPEELGLLRYSVDVLTEPKPVQDAAQLDPKRQGVIVRCRGRLGLLLPDLDGVDTVEQQIEIARRKTGILPNEKAELLCFEVERYH